MIGSRVEEGGRGVDEIAERQGVVGLLYSGKVGHPLDDAVVLDLLVLGVDLDRCTHPHVLRPLEDDAAVVAEQIALLERLEPEIVEPKVAGVVDHLLDLVGVGNGGDGGELLGEVEAEDALGKGRGRVLLVVVDGDAGGEEAVVGVAAADHHRTGLGGEAVQFRRVDPVLNLTAYFLGHESRVHVLKPFGEFFDAGENLVERDLFAFSVSLCYVHYVSWLAMCKCCYDGLP